MSSGSKVVSLRQFISRYPVAREILLKKQLNVICRNGETGRVKVVQFRALYQNNPRFWEHSSTWTYYLESDVSREVVETIRALVEASRIGTAGNNEEDHSNDSDDPGDGAPAEALEELSEEEESEQRGELPEEHLANFGGEYQNLQRLSVTDRQQVIQQGTVRIARSLLDTDTTPEAAAEALVETTRDATLVNRATLLEALRMGDEQARAYTTEVVKETTRMVKTTMRLVDSDVYNDDLVQAVVQRSNGTVVQHMTRVFVTGLEFLLYYNRQVITKGIANRIRIRFRRDYKRFYRQLLPHLHEDYVNLEHVFHGGMKALSEVELTRFATGFLVHDVGKAEDIEYHEGDAGYDRATVERHVKIGYKAVMDKTSYPREAALITGYHHEYYGDPHGYGYFREFLAAYKEANPAAVQDYVMAYAMEPVIDYEVLAYFPAKMLEIVDVFDSLTDPNRRYRSPMTPDEACTMIRQEFIETHLKIDPILFDIFLDFLETKKTR